MVALTYVVEAIMKNGIYKTNHIIKDGLLTIKAVLKDSVYTFSPGINDENIWPFKQPFYLILNLAVGGDFGGQQVDDSMLPQEFVIDYIKVHQ